MLAETIPVGSLAEYINLIQTEQFANCYYRGENQKYDNISSTLVRQYNPTLNDEYGLSDIYKKLLSEYYKEIGNELNELQNKYFIAFAQHHGLKTNLIDFTTAPLVALYFACDGATEDNGSGYVYLLREESTVDATGFLDKHCAVSTSIDNIFNKIAHDDIQVINDFRQVLQRYVGLFNNQKIIDLINVNVSSFYHLDFAKQCQEYINSRQRLLATGVDAIGEMTQLIKDFLPDCEIFGNYRVNEYIALLRLFFRDIQEQCWFTSLSSNIDFPASPYLIYRTPINFDRIRNQCGVFLYQGFADYNTDIDITNGIMIQKIVPDITIEINNQQKILKELDMAGINKKYIYGDFDNTARYINEKFFK